VGSNTHLVGCTLEDCVFVATGVSVFHGARLGYGSEVRVNGVGHLPTELPAHAVISTLWFRRLRVLKQVGNICRGSHVKVGHQYLRLGWDCFGGWSISQSFAGCRVTVN